MRTTFWEMLDFYAIEECGLAPLKRELEYVFCEMNKTNTEAAVFLEDAPQGGRNEAGTAGRTVCDGRD